ncbi:sugar hydrolase [Paenibacillus pinistramenti]|uniref:alpha-L-rhamnosidase-related protein n=1 Tax=Paenibacillus pinistramenti TaxID=1768003 RepID=UPI001EEF82DA|nr:sugar hydrolase [Paenibacillus pinistramenti]
MSQSVQRSEKAGIQKNGKFTAMAEQLAPYLYEEDIQPFFLVKLLADPDVIHGWRTEQEEVAQTLESMELGKGDSVILDFGDHRVGRLSFDVVPVGSPPDAPLYLKLTFGEMPVEMAVPFTEYNGWLSRSWLQEEHKHIDVLPAHLELERRYSFRYVKLEVIDTSVKYKVSIKNVGCRTVTSANITALQEYKHEDPQLREIDRVSIKTLQDCMQEVFEDGPKRDRRLWLGDLRLQALANYETFRSNDLVKRCLYLFAAYPNDKGQVSANLFMKPEVIPDDTYLFDYSLFFVSTLHDYYMEVQDSVTLGNLWPTALRQIDLALELLDERLIVRDQDFWWSFIDWHEDLNKQAASQGVLIYAMKQAKVLASVLKDPRQAELGLKIKQLETATFDHLWDEKLGYFISGKDRQVSWASQIWLVLAGILDSEKSYELLGRLLKEKPGVPLTTPYMLHHLIEALLKAGDSSTAVKELKTYWGGMLQDGADTFWELYDPDNKEFSPYGSHLINSYCHAWSCTPTYFIRKYRL